MKKYYAKRNNKAFKTILILLITCISIIYGCRKDISKIGETPTATAANPKITAAKSWYNTNFPKLDKLASQATNAVNGNDFDLSQFFKPDWTDAKNYTRFGDDVIEMPLDAASKIGLKIGSAEPQSNSRTTVLILKQGEAYKAYLMTLVGDADYLNGDTIKLAKNSYGKRDDNFSGVLYYTTPQGDFVSGCVYKNGIITDNISFKTQSAGRGTLVVQSNGPKVNTAQVCVAWYYTSQYTLSNGTLSPPVLHYGGEDCYDKTPIDLGVPTNPNLPTTPPSGGGGGGGGGTNPTTPDCSGQNVSTIKNGKIINALKIMLLPPGDGGFPTPTPPNNPCALVDPVIIENPVKPCALKFKNITSSWMAVAVSGYKFGIQDPVFGTKFIQFNVEVGMPSNVSIQQAQNATAAAMLVAEYTIAHTHGVDFFLSAGAQATYSREFANIVQAELVLALGSGVRVKNSISAGTPIITYADNC